MKRINRYASLRIPTSIDYEYSVNTRKRCKKWELYRRRCVKNIENIKNKKLSVICYVMDGRLVISCPLCHNNVDFSDIGSRRYSHCKTCGCIYDKESNVAMKYYRRYLPEAYQEVMNKRLNNKNTRNRLKIKHQKEAEEAYIKMLYPQITVWNENGIEEIITNITKEIRESNDFTIQEKDILIKLQIHPDKYRLLKKLNVNFCEYNSESIEGLMIECNNKERGD